MLHYQNKESEYSSSDAESELQETELLKHSGDAIQNEEAIESVFGNGSKESQSQGSERTVRRALERAAQGGGGVTIPGGVQV